MLERELMKLLEEAKKIRQQLIENESASYYDDVFDNLSNFVFCVKVTDKTTTGFKTTVWGSYQQGISTSGYNFVWQVSGVSA